MRTIVQEPGRKEDSRALSLCAVAYFRPPCEKDTWAKEMGRGPGGSLGPLASAPTSAARGPEAALLGAAEQPPSVNKWGASWGPTDLLRDEGQT